MFPIEKALLNFQDGTPLSTTLTPLIPLTNTLKEKKKDKMRFTTWEGKVRTK